MVVPVSKNSFKIKVQEAFVPIANLESLEVSFDSTVETWFAMENEGYQSALKTGIAMSISGSAKRTYGDPGSDELDNTKFEVGEACNKEFQWTMPDGNVATFTAVVSVDSVGGETTAVDTLSFTLTVIGKPEVEEAGV